MSIVKMKKLRLLCLADERKSLLKDLQLLGCVEVSDACDGISASGAGEQFSRCVPPLSDLRTTAAQLSSAMAVLDSHAPAKSGMFSPRPSVTTDKFFDENILTRGREIASEINSLSARITAARSDESRLRGEAASLAPWKGLGFPLEVSSTKQTDIYLGTLPAAVPFGEAEAALSAEEELCFLRLISADKGAQYVVYISHKTATEKGLSLLRTYGFTRILFPDKAGTVEENLTKTEAEISDAAAKAANAAESIAAFAGERGTLNLAIERVMHDIQRSEAEEKLYTSGTVFALEGWLPAAEEEKLSSLLEKYTCAWETSDPIEDEYPDVPVKLKNNALTRCLSMVTEMYSLPAYDGVDPNPLMAPFFILFYGLMLADMGYGVLMIAAAVVALIKMKPRKGMKNFFELMLYCGISATVCGAITGGCFGDAPLQIAKILNPGTTWTGLPALFNPLDDTVMILIGSIALGLIHIITGMAVSFVIKLKQGEYLDAIFEEVTWWLVFAGIGCMALGAGNLVLYIGLGLVVLGPIVMNKGIKKITGLFGSLYNHITGFFGDLLSYSRIMALMLAGSVIAQVFNTIGAIPGNLFIFLLISLVGNALNFALNLLGCYVHDLRLQCLEFFGKFYKDGGRPFKPLHIYSKHYNVDTVNN